MKKLLEKKACLLYLTVSMVLLAGMFVNNAFGSGPRCGPCDFLDWDGYWWRCAGCVVDCGPCYDCNTSTIPPSCHYTCNPGENCMDCDWVATSPNCLACAGCSYDSCHGLTCCPGPNHTWSCCDPNQCQECVGGTCLVCGGREHDGVREECCGGHCYNPRTQRCCTETSPPHICDINAECCNGSCCNPNECQGCVEGSCVTGCCALEASVFDETGCDCDGTCYRTGSVWIIRLCIGEEYCYGNCYCKDTPLSMQITEMRPNCQDIGLWPPGPGCNEKEDCANSGYEEIYNMSVNTCDCVPYGT